VNRVKVSSRKSGFTLIELLTVISIIGILAALVVPALKNFGHSDATLTATRQLLGDVARARQMAMSQRTTVYMVFVPTNSMNFWGNLNYNSSATYNTWFNNLTSAQKTALTNLCDKQMTGYTFVSLRTVGDQPGRDVPHYLTPWQTLPDGAFIASQKFNVLGTLISSASSPVFNQWNIDYPHSDQNKMYAFTNVAIPFPTEDTTNYISMPCIAFNSSGQLTSDGQTLAANDEYIPLAQGTVWPALDPVTRALQLSPPSVTEKPPGNSTNVAYNIIHIDRLTGRAILEYHKVQ
jgi:prepilin-type N-terminal cleavage/methylation domain-containing protein